MPNYELIEPGSLISGNYISKLIDETTGDYLLFILQAGQVDLPHSSIERFLQVAEDTNAGIIYSDFREVNGQQVSIHPLIDYQTGSIRDNFDFGSCLLVSKSAAVETIQKYGPPSDDLKWAGLYDLRLKISTDFKILRIPEPLYTRSAIDNRSTGEKVFDYVDPSKRDYQIEMENVATEHLKRINAWLEPRFKKVPESSDRFSVKAGIIIPVKNRVKTIADALNSALNQITDFPYNIIVVDNHSSDGTTEVLNELASDNERLKCIVPERMDLGIGGCWNEAINSEYCGRYAVQLDSDDIYSGESTLERIVEEFERGGYAMVIGSYKVVDFDLNELPPGLVDHREWTRDNGRNNALRINGLGAPRAFDVSVLRQIGIPNVSYGEDYAVALRISRDFEIGRIYEPLYYARRWSGNSDSALPLETANRYDLYKDRLRTIEIMARQRINAETAEERRGLNAEAAK